MPAKKKPSAAKAAPQEVKQTVLVCVVGTTPGIISETVWALAKRPENPVIPDRVVAITTQAGKRAIIEQLLSGFHGHDPIWKQLRGKLLKDSEKGKKLQFGEEGDHIVVFTMPDEDGLARPLNDIRTAEENQAAADCILKTLDTYTRHPNNHVIGSVAGGRKTMSALMYACMSLVGKEEDRICHVLVPPEYESYNLEPRLYFPEQKPQELVQPDRGKDKKYKANPSQRILKAADANIELVELPFVSLRNAGVSIENSFMQTVAAYSQSQREQELGALKITLHIKTLEIEVDGMRSKPISGTLFLLMLYFAQLVKEKRCGVRPQDEVAAELDKLSEDYKEEGKKDSGERYLSLNTALTRGGGLIKWDGSVSKHKNSLRAELRKLGRSGELLSKSMDQKGYWGMRGVAGSNIKIV
jgi:CRISPR-associated protein (TIGR02584 family)